MAETTAHSNYECLAGLSPCREHGTCFPRPTHDENSAGFNSRAPQTVNLASRVLPVLKTAYETPGLSNNPAPINRNQVRKPC